jgi:hypothetical protein
MATSAGILVPEPQHGITSVTLTEVTMPKLDVEEVAFFAISRISPAAHLYFFHSRNSNPPPFCAEASKHLARLGVDSNIACRTTARGQRRVAAAAGIDREP